MNNDFRTELENFIERHDFWNDDEFNIGPFEFQLYKDDETFGVEIIYEPNKETVIKMEKDYTDLDDFGYYINIWDFDILNEPLAQLLRCKMIKNISLETLD